MTFKTAKTKTTVKTWGQKDTGFYFCPDNISLIPRAAIRIHEHTPYEFRLIIEQCLREGYIIPVAYQPVEEVFLEELTK